MPVNRAVLWGGVAVGGAGLAVYMYRQNKKKQAATQAASMASTAASAGGAYGYGSSAGMYAYGYGTGQLYSPYGYGFGPQGLGDYGYGGDFTGVGGGYYGAGVASPVPVQATTNAQWSQAAQSVLTGAGYSGTDVLAALGQYLIGANLTSAQAGIVSAAIAAEGYPPQEAADGFPPGIKTGGTTGGGQPGTGSTPSAGSISNLQASSVNKTGFTVKWNPVPGTTGYAWKAGPSASWPNATKQGTATGTSVTVSGLSPGTSYNFGIQALPGGAGDNIHVTTSK